MKMLQPRGKARAQGSQTVIHGRGCHRKAVVRCPYLPPVVSFPEAGQKCCSSVRVRRLVGTMDLLNFEKPDANLVDPR